MSDRYQNTGAPFRAENGDFIARGQIFTPSPRDLAQRAHKLRPADPTAADRPTREPVDPPAPAQVERFPGFPGIDFASQRAYEVAREAGLGPIAFDGVKGSGENGAFRLEDVRAILGED